MSLYRILVQFGCHFFAASPWNSIRNFYLSPLLYILSLFFVSLFSTLKHCRSRACLFQVFYFILFLFLLKKHCLISPFLHFKLYLMRYASFALTYISFRFCSRFFPSTFSSSNSSRFHTVKMPIVYRYHQRLENRRKYRKTLPLSATGLREA